MKPGNDAKLLMKKTLRKGSNLDEKPYLCKVFRYDVKQESIYLVLKNDEVTALSLDAIYECSIRESERDTFCTGRIKERYHNESGKILKFEIENGFYKINLKSVDK
ncbi:MAG: hypothetical protein IJ439_04660 [Tyzzerella sp.]|nr:hypothetical protein [Tyzzerella sp.]